MPFSTMKLRPHIARLFPNHEIVAIEPLASDPEKPAGYSVPVRIVLTDRHGDRRELIFRTASANEFGHDRRADRLANLAQAFDDFARTPRHVEAIDLGLVREDQTL